MKKIIALMLPLVLIHNLFNAIAYPFSGAPTAVLVFRGCPANGCHRNYYCNGQRLDYLCSHFLLATEVREVENISDHITWFLFE